LSSFVLFSNPRQHTYAEGDVSLSKEEEEEEEEESTGIR